MKMSKVHGNDVYYCEESNKWLYISDNEPVATQYPERPCGNCGKKYTKEGHDACLGTLIGTMNACCGHGDLDECYIQFLDGECIRGEDAKIIQDILKKYKQ